jgi:hypothetical protein
MGGTGNPEVYLCRYLGACKVAVHPGNPDKISILPILSCDLKLRAPIPWIALVEMAGHGLQSVVSPEWETGQDCDPQ